MTCEEVKLSLHDFFDELLSTSEKREVEAHLRTCTDCLEEYKRLRKFFNILKDLPYNIDPPSEIITKVSSELLARSTKSAQVGKEIPKKHLKKLKRERERQEKRLKALKGAARKSTVATTAISTRVYPGLSSIKYDLKKIIFILTPLILIGAGYLLLDYMKYNSPWRVRGVEGQYFINGNLENSGKLSQGQTFLTGNNSKAIINVPKVGRLEVDPNTLLQLIKAKDGSNTIMLKVGMIRIVTAEDLPDLIVTIKKLNIVDYGGVYTINVDDNGSVDLKVESGDAVVNYNNVKTYVSGGYVCNILKGVKVGTPYREDAPEELKEEVKKFDNGSNNATSIDKIIRYARQSDAFTLFDLIKKTALLERGKLFQAIANYFPPPESVTKNGIMELDKKMLLQWWEDIEWQL